MTTAKITFADILRPAEKNLAFTYDIFLILVGSLFIAASAQIAIYLPFSPVPVTGQTFAVLFTGFLLGPKRAVLSLVLYLGQGIAGLPVFAAVPKAGVQVLFGPTGGYIVGFIPAAFITGLLARQGWDRGVWSTVAAMIIGNCILYTFGLIWLCCFLGPSYLVLQKGLYPFLIGDILKIVLAALVLPTGWKLLAILKNPQDA